MRVLITSGGTSEYIDDVRVLTNISTGKLGAIIADTFLRAGHEVVYVHGRNAKLPAPYFHSSLNLACIEARNVAQLIKVMDSHVPETDVVIHAMAVSDFTFERENPVKVKSTDMEAFIEFMRANIRQTPKVIYQIKKQNPDVILVGFKFEVGVHYDELYSLAMDSIRKNGCDLVVANDKEEMVREKCHIAHIIDSKGWRLQARGKQEIAEELLKEIERIF